MSRSSVDVKTDCMNQCDNQFTRCSSVKHVGCVEALRICRDNCRLSSKQ